MNESMLQFLEWFEKQIELIVVKPYPKKAFIEFSNSQEFARKAANNSNFWMHPRYNTIVAKYANKIV